MLSSEIKRDDRGVDRCNRKVFTAVQKVMGDDSKGYKNVEAYCNQPIVQRISDGVKGCPRCDKEPPVGNVHPKTINAASIALTPKELEECGVSEDTSKLNTLTKVINAMSEFAVEAKMSEIRKDDISLLVPLEVLEGTGDIAAYLIKKASEALDELPVTNFKESKRLIKIQEKLEALLRV